MYKEYDEKILYSHGEKCMYKGKIYQASCYHINGIRDINPEEGINVFWPESEEE